MRTTRGLALLLVWTAACADVDLEEEAARDAGWTDANPLEEELEALARLVDDPEAPRDPERFVFDTLPPTGSVSINMGATYTATSTVTLTLSATDVDGVSAMCVSNSVTCAPMAYASYATSLSWTLGSTEGTQTARVWFRDSLGNTNSTPYLDTITLDKSGPGNGTVTPTPGDMQNTLAWSGFSDSISAVASYKVVWSATAYPTSCSAGTTLYTGTGTTTTHTGLTNGTLYYYRVCGIDTVGNIGSGATASARPAPEFVAPTGTLSINAGASWANSTSVSLTVTASDLSTPLQMCLSNTSACTSWQAVSSPVTWTLSGTGTRTVYLLLRDSWFNTTATAITDSINVDNVPPLNGTFTVTPGNTQNAMVWSGFSDASSGINQYKIVWSTSGTPANCSSGTLLYTGTSLSTTHTGLTNGTTYYYRLCAVDVAGNTSSGTGGSGRPAPEFGPPTGSVSINGGASYTLGTSVSLTISANDPSTPVEMCVTNSTTCTAWQAVTSPLSWTLTSGAGLRTVTVKLRDAWGNQTSVSDTITLDGLDPVDGTLTAYPTDGRIDLVWTAAYDVGSGVVEYRLAHSTTSYPTNCASSLLFAADGTFYSHIGLTNGVTHYYRVCAVDAAGNVSPGATTWGISAPESEAPYGTIEINAGDAWTSSSDVTITMDVVDETGIATMCAGTSPYLCTDWQPYADTLVWTLDELDGTHTVYLWFGDDWNNVTTTPISDSIGLDTTYPLGGTVTPSPGNGFVSLAWSGFSDTYSGVDQYRVVRSTTAYPNAYCTTGTTLYTGPSASYMNTGLVNGTTYYYRVCAIDSVGNVSPGVGVTGRPAPEFVLPVGTVSINAGAAWTKTTAVTLTLSATDASGVTHMCLSNVGKCTSWVGYVTSTSWTLSGTGTRSVYATFRDTWGNVSVAAASDSIGVDGTAPVNGTLVVTPGDMTNTITWSGFSDTGAGITEYRLRYSTTATPNNCSVLGTGVPLYTGLALTRAHSGLTNGTTYYYRVCAVDAAGNVSSGATGSGRPAPEFVGPAGSVSIAAGAAYTSTGSVTLTLSATDASGVTQMCVTNGTTCSSWVAYATSLSWTLTSGSGDRTVTVTFRDMWGNTGVASDAIYVDTVAPYNGTLTATPGDGQVTLGWTGFGDPLSGISSYRLKVGTSATPANCSGMTQYSGTSTSYTHTGLINGTTYYYRLCAVDAAGNMSSGATDSAIAAPESTPPTGGVTIAGGAAYTATSSVTLAITASDPSGVADMCISNGTTCSAWQTFAATPSWTLPAYDATHTVRVWLRDSWGNTTASPVSDTIVKDSTVPVNGTVTVTPADGEVALSWSGFDDPTSGVDSYTLVRSASAMPTSCASGTVLISGTATSWNDTGLVNGSTYFYRVCATDEAGNTSAGVGTTGRPAPEFVPPVGSVTIDSDALWSTSTSVTLTLTASDASGVGSVCVSNTTVCTTWVSYAASMSWTLSGTGTRTVYVRYRDTWNNTSGVVSDSIDVDAAAPTSGTMTRTAMGTSIDVAWSGFSDGGSGIDHFTLTFGTTSAPACGAGTVIYTGSGTSHTHSGLTTGTTYYYRLCATDVAGNVSTGISGSTSL